MSINLSIRNKLLLMSLVPTLCLCGIAGLRVRNDFNTMSEMNAVTRLSDLATNISVLVHSTQKERGLTAGFLGSKGKRFQTELPTQRNETDRNLKSFNDFLDDFECARYGDEFEDAVSAATRQLGELAQMRSAVSSQSIASGPAIGYYTDTNTCLLEIVSKMAGATSHAAIASQINGYVHFLEGKERAGIERAVMSNTFAQDTFGPGVYAKFITLVAEQSLLLGQFEDTASSDALSFYKGQTSSSSFAAVNGFRTIANDKATEGEFGVDAAKCFGEYTQKINALKEIDDYLAAELVTNATAGRSAAITSASLSAGIGSFLLLAVALGGMATARSIMKVITMVIESIQKIAEGDLTQRIDDSRTDEFGTLIGEINKFVEIVHGLVSNVSGSAHEVAGAATEIAATSEEIATGMSMQKEEIARITATMAEMNSAVREVADQSSSASSGAARSGNNAEEGEKIVGESVESIESLTITVNESAAGVEELGRKSEEIGDIINVINDIADQTNLLALNAAIEAARAGEHGRGFAVVADEVRVLADRTTKATDEIASSIREIQGKTTVAVDRMKEGASEVNSSAESARKAGETLREIVQSSTEVAQMVDAIAAATEEQSSSADQINRSIESVSSVIREASEGTGQAAEASSELSQKAEDLRSTIQYFKV